MAGKGGHRQGAGRKTKAEEDRVRNLAVKSIISKFGSEEAGFKSLLESGEPSLIKFVYEHAFGKPKEKVEHSGGMDVTWNEVKTYETE
jgi:hypothetical protein